MSKLIKSSLLAMLMVVFLCTLVHAYEYVVLTQDNPNATVSSGESVTIYGTSDANHITVESGADVVLMNFLGSNTVSFESDSEGFTVSRSGAEVIFEGEDGTVVKIPATETSQVISFTDCSHTLAIASDQVMLSGQVVSTVASAIEYTVAPEIVQLVPMDTDTISIAWLPALVPGLSGFVYEVHVSTSDNFTPSAATLKQEVTDDLQAEITGLTSGTAFFVLIGARIGSGESLYGNDYREVTTLDASFQFNDDVALLASEDLGLGIPEVSGDDYIFQATGSQVLPETGDIIVGEDSEGGYLRKVEAVTDTGDEIVVQTSQGILSEAVTSGRISNSLTLFDPDDTTTKQRTASKASLSVKQTKDADGCSVSRMAWKNGLLTVEERLSPKFVSSARAGYRSARLLKDGSNELTIDANLTFEPDMDIDLEWHTDGLTPVIESGEVILIGTIRADMDVRYQFNGAYEWGSADDPKEKELLRRTWKSIYSVGGVPVYQDITLTLTVQAWATATAAIDAEVNAFAETEIQVGIRYNETTKTWEPVVSTDFEKGLTAVLHAEGSVEGEVRLVPSINFKFYKVAGSTLSLEPYNHGLINYTVDDSLDGPAIMQFNNFDYYLGLDANMNLTLWPIFDEEDPLYEGKLYSNTWAIFDLPQMEITSSRNGDTWTLSANIEDGTNNPFDYSSIEWEVFDADFNRYSLADGAYDGTGTAEFTPETEGTYTILMSGYGTLGDWFGEAGRRYAVLEISGETSECGAYIAPGVWKAFDCYNLAAVGKTTGDDPFTPSWRLIGGYWHWGRKGPNESQWYDTNTANFAHGPTSSDGGDANDEWIDGWDDSYADDGAWSDAYKTANDPCPAGYRVPTETQWDGVNDNNTQSTVGTWSSSNTNYSSGCFLGEDLMLPAAGYRNSYGSGSLYGRGSYGYYWSSTENSSNSSNAWSLSFNSGNAGTAYGLYRSYGFSVRCVAE